MCGGSVFDHIRPVCLHRLRRGDLRHDNWSRGEQQLFILCCRPVFDGVWERGMHGLCIWNLQYVYRSFGLYNLSSLCGWPVFLNFW